MIDVVSVGGSVRFIGGGCLAPGMAGTLAAAWTGSPTFGVTDPLRCKGCSDFPPLKRGVKE
jgi:hypothetical protein